MPELVILDYGVGNLFSLKNALEEVGLTVRIKESIKQSNKIDAIALPGVGHFTAAARKLEFINQSITTIVDNGTPLLGICLGLQLLFQESDEGPGRGLGIFRGKNVRLSESLKVPHMGWNTLKIVKQNEILKDVVDNSFVYFVHSLYPIPVEKEIVATKTEYGETFTSMIAYKNVFGTQFHPEKSGPIGLKILSNFAKIVKR
ncbi:MAG TPA: imidazole glycerol phosphate synthase subunit HisH [Candidatus Glassbacteria bacterium]|nr:imidazole glycerol phosphate synthase subunit HisH [Candidatus Glassbacteria bacterium]